MTSWLHTPYRLLLDILTSSYCELLDHFVSILVDDVVIECLYILISVKGADPDVQNINKQTALHLAVERQNIQIVRVCQL